MSEFPFYGELSDDHEIVMALSDTEVTVGVGIWSGACLILAPSVLVADTVP